MAYTYAETCCTFDKKLLSKRIFDWRLLTRHNGLSCLLKNRVCYWRSIKRKTKICILSNNHIS